MHTVDNKVGLLQHMVKMVKKRDILDKITSTQAHGPRSFPDLASELDCQPYSLVSTVISGAFVTYWEGGTAEKINGYRYFLSTSGLLPFQFGFQLTNCGLRNSEKDQRMLLEFVQLVVLHYLVCFCFVRDPSPRFAPLLYLANLTCLLHKS